MRLLSIVLCSLPLWAADPVLHQNFASGTEGWISMGEGSGLEAKDSALHFHYNANARLSVAAMPVGSLAMAEMKSIRFELRTDSPTAIAVLLAEKKPGGNYAAVVWSNGGAWQSVTLTPADFAVNDGPTDPVDPDHKLDLDQIENVALLDMSQFFNKLSNGEVPFYVEPHQGPRLLSIRNFEILREGPKPLAMGVVDDFSRPQASWFTFGGVAFDQSDGKLTLRYREMEGKGTVISRIFPANDFRGATHLAMDVQSDHPVQFVISLKERRAAGEKEGPRYNAEFFIPAGSAPEHREVALSAFNPDENGPKDANGKLDPEAIHDITMMDISGETAAVTLTMANLRLVRVN